ALLKEKGLEYTEQIGQELAQEMTQAASEGLAEWKSGVAPPADKRGIFERGWDTIKTMAISAPWLMGPKTATDVTGIVSEGDTTPVAAPAVVPPVTPHAAAGVPPAGAIPPVIPPVTPPVQPPGVPPVTPPITPPGAAVPPVTPPITPPVTPVTPPVTPPPISPGTAAEVVDEKVQSDNAKVNQMADEQAQKLQAAGAPATAEAIKQAAGQSNEEASVTAEEFMRAAQAKREAEEGATGAVTPAEGAKGAAIPATPPTAAAPISPGRAAATPRTTQEHAIVVGGQLFTGQTASEAMDAAMDHVGPDAMNSATTGWVDVDNKFISHEAHDASQELAAAIGGGAGDPGDVKKLQAQVQQLMNRDTELNNQIIRPGGEQVIVPGINGQEAVVTARPSQQLSQPLAGVKVDMDVVMPDGTPGT